MSDPDSATAFRPATPRPSSHGDLGGARFTPGAVLGDRYRIVSLLGEGGMGEIYRADDIKLGQRVALKYIPDAITGDPQILERLYAEVRIGRQVSHPNVCRLYDLAEIDGHHFIAMEYVDGEDLASLLRRIGRLPADKALTLARHICAGLAAAHDRGIVHRDLKPSNIMIDGQGNARITDFGLAALADELARRTEFAGTPAYMAPEQLAGAPATTRSDLYALGLVLYEMFTGKRLFAGATMEEIRVAHSTTKSRPSSVVRDIDPAIERVILRCIEENSAERPPSIHAVIAALPGGDPLQAAIDAGETPSPAMVAAAGRVGDLAPARAWGLLGGLVAAMIGAVIVHERAYFDSLLPRLKPREVLADRARDIARNLGGTGEPADTNENFAVNRPYLTHLSKTVEPGAWSERLADAPPSPLLFIYRESPQTMISSELYGRIQPENPPHVLPGMASLTLDHEGRLRFYHRVPPHRAEAAVPAVEVDWPAVFAEAGLDFRDFQAAEPEWTPPVGSDRQYAWTGTYPSRPDVGLRVEAASHRGSPVYFQVIEPWVTSPGVASRPLGATMLTLLTIIATAGAALFARRNVVRGRGDRRGARYVFLFVTACHFLSGMAMADHAASLNAEWSLTTRLAGVSLFLGLQVWLFYLAVEPYVRRRWPHMLIAWSRLLSGRVRDPLVGRDLLVGALAGTAAAAAVMLPPAISAQLGSWRHLASVIAAPPNHNTLGFMYQVFAFLAIAVMYALGWLILLVLLRHLIRHDTAAVLVLWLVVTLVGIGPRGLPDYLESLPATAILVLLLRRAGLLAVTAGFFFYYMLLRLPLTFDFSNWYAVRSTAGLLLLFAIGAWGFWISLAGKPVFGSFLVDEEAPA